MIKKKNGDNIKIISFFIEILCLVIAIFGLILIKTNIKAGIITKKIAFGKIFSLLLITHYSKLADLPHERLRMVI